MGIFGGKNGDHDANGGSDGYVSPFDDRSNYVNINDTSNHVDADDSPHDPTYIIAAADAAATKGRNEATASNWTAPSNTRPNTPSNTAPNTPTSRKRPYSGADAALRHNARQRDPDARRAGAQARRKRRHPIRNIIAIIVILYLLSDVFPGIGSFFGLGGDSDGRSRSSSYSSYSPPKTAQPLRFKVLDRTGNLTYVERSDKTLSADFTIVSAQRGPKSCSGQNTLLVKYQTKNTSTTDIDMTSYLSFDVYDSGIGLRNIGCFAGDNPKGYEFSDTMRKIRPGASMEFMQAYELRNAADTSYDVRVGSHSRNMPTSIGASFTLPKDVNDLAATDVAKPGQIIKPDMPKDFTQGMTRLTGASYRYDDVTAGRQVDVKPVSAVKGPKTYKGAPTVIVTYRWVNRTPIPLSFTDAVTTTVYQNGVELKPTSFSDRFPGHSVATRDVPVMQDVPMTTTMAYELGSESQPVTTSMKGFASIGDKTVTKDLTLG